ncbi:hypothetical protein UFOVP661_37 [uncultured Caudovirales phage]|uniref:Uncharacterized protein n=1 Tax=uncultured Caudovirales phage TaxID=2100421 RepID=A0A6J5NLH6_9CAUD|nr:hypothetical protein UFOVP661_37 [uncultured Caudovirales phage]
MTEDARPLLNQILKALDDGDIDPKLLAESCLFWLSEKSLKQMIQTTDMFYTAVAKAAHLKRQKR